MVLVLPETSEEVRSHWEIKTPLKEKETIKNYCANQQWKSSKSKYPFWLPEAEVIFPILSRGPAYRVARRALAWTKPH